MRRITSALVSAAVACALSVIASEGWTQEKKKPALTLITPRTTIACDGGVGSVVWRPDGKVLASGGEGGVKLWHAATGKALAILNEHILVGSLSWSPDGKSLASADFDSTVKLWDVGTRKELVALKYNQGLVFSVSWSPDGKILLTAAQPMQQTLTSVKADLSSR